MPELLLALTSICKQRRVHSVVDAQITHPRKAPCPGHFCSDPASAQSSREETVGAIGSSISLCSPAAGAARGSSPRILFLRKRAAVTSSVHNAPSHEKAGDRLWGARRAHETLPMQTPSGSTSLPDLLPPACSPWAGRRRAGTALLLSGSVFPYLGSMSAMSVNSPGRREVIERAEQALCVRIRT